jgi:hypothetical protein
MNKKTLGILLSVLVVLSGACSVGDEKVKPSNESNHKDDQKTVSVGQSSTDSNENGDEDAQPSPKAEKESETKKNQNPAAQGSEEDKNTATETSELKSVEKDFDPENYLNKYYPIDHTHYITNTWENEDTGETELTVKILPDTKEYGKEIDDVFKHGSPFLDDERTITMKEIAEDIVFQLPETYDDIHVDSVNWVSYDGGFAVTLVQDYR